MADLLNGRNQSLRGGGFRRFSAAVDGDDELDDVLACGGSGEDSWWLHGVSYLSFSHSLYFSLLLLSNFSFYYFFGAGGETNVEVDIYRQIIFLR